jgi:putative membrane protein
MADPPNDPRVYFAAERTLLAWVRTGLTVMAFGFVVARFGLFLQLLRAEVPGAILAGPGLSAQLGAGLVLLGVLALVNGGWAFQRYCRTVSPRDLPYPTATVVPLLFVAALTAAGAVLVWVLLR